MQPTKNYAQKIFQLLKEHYPHAKMILEWSNNWELLVAIILSAQCTDKKVNEVTVKLFFKYKQKRTEFESLYKKYTSFILGESRLDRDESKDLSKKGPKYKIRIPRFDHQYQNYSRIVIPKEELIELVNMMYVPISELEQDIRSTGFYHNKAKNIQAAAKVVLEKYKDVLPNSIAELTTIPGVGRKTANVFLGNAYNIYEGIAVDTHVAKQSQLLGLSKNSNPEKIEQDLMNLFPQKDWFALTYLLIEHGRNMRRKKSDRVTCGKIKCLLCDNSSKG